MKKRKLLTILLGSVFSLLLVAGCGESCNGDDTGSGGDGGDVSAQNEVLLAGFESYEEMRTYHYTNYFGAAKPSKEYVTQGEGGAAITVNGRYDTTQRPAIVIDTQTELLEKSDFSDVSEIKLDVRNDNAYAANVYLQYGLMTETGLKLSSAMKKTLDVGFSGTVTFTIDRSLVSEFLDISYVTELRIVFDSPKEAIPTLSSTAEALANYRKFHIDNLRAVTTTDEIVKSAVRNPLEIESGDKEEYLAAWYLPSGYMWSPSSVSYNTDPAYIRGGNGSLKFKLEGTQRDAGKSATAYWAMSVNQNPDISDCYAVGFWMYNAEPTQPINLWSHNPVGGKEKHIQKLAYGWNYIEISVNDLRDTYEYDDKNFLFGMVLQFVGGADYDVYLDEMYALRYTTPEISLPAGENVGNLYHAIYNEGATVTLPTATAKYAESQSVKVFGPDGEEVAVSNNAFTASAKGEYTVTYTATAQYPNEEGVKETAEKSILIAVGTLPAFNNTARLTNVYDAPAGTTYTITETALSAGQVSWQIETYGGRFNGAGKAGVKYEYNSNGYTNGVISGSPSSFYLVKDIDHRIVYTSKNSDGLRAQFIQHIYVDEPMILLSDRYEGFYDPTRVGGDLTVNEAGDGFVLKTDGTKATGQYSNSIMVGYQANFLRFMVYNAGDTEVTFKINNGMTFTIAAKGYALFNPDSFGYQAAVIGWKMVSVDSKLLPLTFTSTNQTSGIELHISRFGVNEAAFGPPILSAPQYEEFYEVDTKLTIGKASLTGLGSYQYRVTAPDGSIVLADISTEKNDMIVDLLQTGTYTVEYWTSYPDYDGKVLDLKETRTFKVLSDKPTFIEETQSIVDYATLTDGAYTFTEADKPELALSDGTTASVTQWKVYKFHRDYKTQITEGVNSASDTLSEREAEASELVADGDTLTGLVPAQGYSYRIEYKISADGEEFTVNKTIYFVGTENLVNITEVYADFYSAGTASGSVTASEEFGIVLSGAGGVATLSGEYKNPVTLGNATKMTLVFRNSGEEDIFIYFHGAGETSAVRIGVKAKHYAALEFNETALKGWGFMDENGTFGGLSGTTNRLAMKAINPMGKVNVSLCAIYLNNDALLPVMDGIEYESEYLETDVIAIKAPTTLVNVTSYTVTVTKKGETTPVFTCTSEDIGTDNGKVSLPTGEYVITYSAEYTLGGETKTYTKEYEIVSKLDVNNSATDGLIEDKWNDLSAKY